MKFFGKLLWLPRFIEVKYDFFFVHEITEFDILSEEPARLSKIINRIQIIDNIRDPLI